MYQVSIEEEEEVVTEVGIVVGIVEEEATAHIGREGGMNIYSLAKQPYSNLFRGRGRG